MPGQEMIISAEEFIALVQSDDPMQRSRSMTESATIDVWTSIVKNYSDYEVLLLNNITLPLEIFEQLAASQNWRTRHAVAKKRKVGTTLIKQLSCDAEPLVRQAVASNQKTPMEVLTFLANDSDDRVKRVAIYNLNNRKP